MVEAIVQYRTRNAAAKNSLMLIGEQHKGGDAEGFLLHSDLLIVFLIQLYQAECWAQSARKF